jgi:hypothetical protein
MIILSLMQILSWMGAGYNVRSHNAWAALSFVLLGLILGIAQTINFMNKGTTNV